MKGQSSRALISARRTTARKGTSEEKETANKTIQCSIATPAANGCFTVQRSLTGQSVHAREDTVPPMKTWAKSSLQCRQVRKKGRARASFLDAAAAQENKQAIMTRFGEDIGAPSRRMSGSFSAEMCSSPGFGGSWGAVFGGDVLLVRPLARVWGGFR